MYEKYKNINSETWREEEERLFKFPSRISNFYFRPYATRQIQGSKIINKYIELCFTLRCICHIISLSSAYFTQNYETFLPAFYGELTNISILVFARQMNNIYNKKTSDYTYTENMCIDILKSIDANTVTKKQKLAIQNIQKKALYYECMTTIWTFCNILPMMHHYRSSERSIFSSYICQHRTMIASVALNFLYYYTAFPQEIKGTAQYAATVKA